MLSFCPLDNRQGSYIIIHLPSYRTNKNQAVKHLRKIRVPTADRDRPGARRSEPMFRPQACPEQSRRACPGGLLSSAIYWL